MRRALLGALLGGFATFGVVFVIVLAVSPACESNYLATAIVAALLGGNGATAGAVIGAVADVKAELRRALPIGQSAERDYGEIASADHDPMAGLLPALRVTGLVVLIAAGLAMLVLAGTSP